MQNTKIEYSSSDRTPVVLPEMEQLLPPLSAEQFSALERDISENGCYAPVTEENVRCWVEGTRMRTDEIEDSAKDAENLSEVFAAIAGILRTMLPIKVG